VQWRSPDRPKAPLPGRNRALHFDVAQNQDRRSRAVRLRHIQEDYWIDHGETDPMIKRGIDQRNAGHHHGRAVLVA